MSTIDSNESNCNGKSLDEYELVQVQILTRHGARTPVTNLKINDFPNFEEALWDVERFGKISELSDLPIQVQTPNGEKPPSKYDQKHFSKAPLKGGMLIGKLTNVGQQQLLLFGKKLRENISEDFLSSSYNPNEMVARSSNIERTIMSACCFIVGLYGKENIKEAIKVDTYNEEEEYIYPNWVYCKQLKDSFQQLNFITTFPHINELTIKINKLLGIDDTDQLINLVAIHDIIACRQAHGFAIPESIIPHVEEIKDSASELYATAVRGLDRNNLKQLRYACGDFLDEICQNIEKSKAGKGTFKMKLYSTHDTSLICFLMVVGKWKNDLLPSFASNIVLELYKNQNDEYFINMIYNGEEMKFFEDGKYFPLYKFLYLVNPYRSSTNLKENGAL